MPIPPSRRSKDETPPSARQARKGASDVTDKTPHARRPHLKFVFAFYLVFAIGLLIDCLWPLWNKRNQALHDKAVGSIVVRQTEPA
jgi:hypothetical protein